MVRVVTRLVVYAIIIFLCSSGLGVARVSWDLRVFDILDVLGRSAVALALVIAFEALWVLFRCVGGQP